jgi:hypothetical protein
LERPLNAVISVPGKRSAQWQAGCATQRRDTPVLLHGSGHLDLPSKIALEQMLNQYQGALIVVSHDSAFLQAIHLDAEFHLDSEALVSGAG